MRIPVAKPAPKQEEVRQQAAQQRAAEVQRQTQVENTWNAQGHVKKGVRKHPLGTLSVFPDEFDGTVGMPANSRRQFYDVRYDIWACKFLISYWGRNAYTTKPKGGAARPIRIHKDAQNYDVHCHIDITTPNANVLWHGDVEGPHIIVESYQAVGALYWNPARGHAIELTPAHVKDLALHQHAFLRGTDAAPASMWPAWLLEALGHAIKGA